MRAAMLSLLLLASAVDARAQTPPADAIEPAEGFGIGLELSAHLFRELGDQFTRYSGLSVGLAWYTPLDWLAIEAWSTVPGMMRHEPTELVSSVYDYELLTPEAVDLKHADRMSFTGVRFSPLHETAWFYGAQLDYRIELGLAAGLVRSLESCVPNRDGCGEDIGIGRGYRVPEEGAYHGALALSVGARLQLMRWLGLRLDLRNVRYSDVAEDAGERTESKPSLYFLMFGLAAIF